MVYDDVFYTRTYSRHPTRFMYCIYLQSKLNRNIIWSLDIGVEYLREESAD